MYGHWFRVGAHSSVVAGNIFTPYICICVIVLNALYKCRLWLYKCLEKNDIMLI
jgi:hypothetical protein